MSPMSETPSYLKTLRVCLIVSALGCSMLLAARLWFADPPAAAPPAAPTAAATAESPGDGQAAPPPQGDPQVSLVDPPPEEIRLPNESPVESQGLGDPLVAYLVAAALRQTEQTRLYDPAYVRLDYPGGDVPLERGVCADVIVRAYRGIGLDLQKEVHEDMAAHFRDYPSLWGLTKPDANIDHRRVANLRVFFKRHGQTLPVADRGDDYAAGDIVIWQLPANRLHIGLVIDRRSADGRRPLLVHNVGVGAKAEDVLTAWPITDHFRYHPRQRRQN